LFNRKNASNLPGTAEARIALGEETIHAGDVIGEAGRWTIPRDSMLSDCRIKSFPRPPATSAAEHQGQAHGDSRWGAGQDSRQGIASEKTSVPAPTASEGLGIAEEGFGGFLQLTLIQETAFLPRFIRIWRSIRLVNSPRLAVGTEL